MKYAIWKPAGLFLAIWTAGLLLRGAPDGWAQNTMGDVTGNTGVITQGTVRTSGFYTFKPPYPSCLTIQAVVSLCNDGKVKVEPGVKGDKAAMEFIATLKKLWPAMFEKKRP